MYSLNVNYYTKEFNTIDELADDVIENMMDPSHEITKDDVPIGEFIVDFIVE